MTSPVLALEQLTYRWPHRTEPVLDIQHLEVAAGSRTFVHGPSGCGKSTLLGLMAGIVLPSSGHVRLLGQNWGDLAPARRDRYRADHVGYIFQQFNLVPYLSALQNVLAPCYFSDHRRRAARAEATSPEARAQELLLNMGLSSKDIRQPSGRLSVGQQQRVAAARALIGRPALIIADEPTSALDEENCENFMQHLLEAATQANSAIVFVSHQNALGRYFDQRVYLPELNRVQTGMKASANTIGVIQ